MPDDNADKAIPCCEGCGSRISPVTKKDGQVWGVTDIVNYSKKRFNRQLCVDCQRAAAKAEG